MACWVFTHCCMELCSDGEGLLPPARGVSSTPISAVVLKATGGMMFSVLRLNQTTRGELEIRAMRTSVREAACIRHLPYRCKQYTRLPTLWALGLAGLVRPYPAGGSIS